MAVGLPASTPALPADVSIPVAPLAAGAEDEVFTIHGLSWDQYVAINDALGDHAAVRTLFLDGSLTFVSPAALHEEGEDALDAVIKAVAIALRLPLRPIGSTTLRRMGVEAGVEGDRVYYLGESVAQLHDVAAIDLNVLPPPDLAIEVENTHKATDAMAIYAQLGVPEIWRRDVRRGSLTFNQLQGDGTYQPQDQSVHFPFLAPHDLLAILRQADEIRNYTEWVDVLAAWVRDVIRPRLDAALRPEEERP